MCAHADDGRRAGVGRRRARASRAARLSALLCGGLILCAPLAAPAATSKVKTVAVRDTEDDGPDGGIDVTRVQLGLAGDGRLRAVISLADDLDPADMISSTGPPASVCLRLWTILKPGSVPPDFLICVTADKAGKKLHAVVSREQVDAQPKRVGTAQLSMATASQLTLKFGRSMVGSPTKSVFFSAEATRRACTRLSCIDTAPDAPKTGTLKLATSTRQTSA